MNSYIEKGEGPINEIVTFAIDPQNPADGVDRIIDVLRRNGGRFDDSKTKERVNATLAALNGCRSPKDPNMHMNGAWRLLETINKIMIDFGAESDLVNILLNPESPRNVHSSLETILVTLFGEPEHMRQYITDQLAFWETYKKETPETLSTWIEVQRDFETVCAIEP